MLHRRLLAACILLAAPVLAPASDETDLVLVDAPGRARVQAACSMCHSLDYIVMNSPFLDRGGWERTVNKMVTVMGAPLSAEDAAEITAYLDRHYGRDSALAKPAPRTVGRAEFEAATLQGRTVAAIADFRAAAELDPDLKRGEIAYTTCAACHGSDGRGNRQCVIPAIASQHVSVLVKQLVDFRHDRRWEERMQHFAAQHSLGGPQELLDVAAYAESLARWPPLEGGPGDPAALERGTAIYHRDCADCHGSLALGELRRMRPRLAGQHYGYLLRQLEETAAGQRPGMDAEHLRLIAAMSAGERSAVADYLSRLSPNLASTKNSGP